MEEESFTFSSFNDYTKEGIAVSLQKLNKTGKAPIIICVGSDLVLGDSLGPLVGTLLKKKNISAFIYGTLNFPITAKEVEYAKKYLKQMHPNSLSVAIDAAVGCKEDVGLIRVVNKGLKPGKGVDKNLGIIGDISIVGIVAEKSVKNYGLYNLTRLNLVFKMAEQIADGLEKYILSYQREHMLLAE